MAVVAVVCILTTGCAGELPRPGFQESALQAKPGGRCDASDASEDVVGVDSHLAQIDSWVPVTQRVVAEAIDNGSLRVATFGEVGATGELAEIELKTDAGKLNELVKADDVAEVWLGVQDLGNQHLMTMVFSASDDVVLVGRCITRWAAQFHSLANDTTHPTVIEAARELVELGAESEMGRLAARNNPSG